jgi:hypothetical protein
MRPERCVRRTSLDPHLGQRNISPVRCGRPIIPNRKDSSEWDLLAGLRGSRGQGKSRYSRCVRGANITNAPSTALKR